MRSWLLNRRSAGFERPNTPHGGHPSCIRSPCQLNSYTNGPIWTSTLHPPASVPVPQHLLANKLQVIQHGSWPPFFIAGGVEGGWFINYLYLHLITLLSYRITYHVCSWSLIILTWLLFMLWLVHHVQLSNINNYHVTCWNEQPALYQRSVFPL